MEYDCFCTDWVYEKPFTLYFDLCNLVLLTYIYLKPCYIIYWHLPIILLFYVISVFRLNFTKHTQLYLLLFYLFEVTKYHLLSQAHNAAKYYIYIHRFNFCIVNCQTFCKFTFIYLMPDFKICYIVHVMQL